MVLAGSASMDRSNPWARCPDCEKPLWREQCYNSRCSTKSAAHMKRQAMRVRLNLEQFRGDVAMVTVTGPGADILPWDGKTVHSETAWAWNYTAFERWAKLRDIASRYASRKTKGVRSGILVVVPELQSRGVLHFHIVLGAETARERAWAATFVAGLRKNATSHAFGRQVDFHRSSWGPVRDRGVASYVSKLGAYITKSHGLRDLWEGHDLPGRAFYVSRRLTEQTGLTVRNLRRRSKYWSQRKLSIPAKLMPEWLGFEKALGRELTYMELEGLTRMSL